MKSGKVIFSMWLVLSVFTSQGQSIFRTGGLKKPEGKNEMEYFIEKYLSQNLAAARRQKNIFYLDANTPPVQIYHVKLLTNSEGYPIKYAFSVNLGEQEQQALTPVFEAMIAATSKEVFKERFEPEAAHILPLLVFNKVDCLDPEKCYNKTRQILNHHDLSTFTDGTRLKGAVIFLDYFHIGGSSNNTK